MVAEPFLQRTRCKRCHVGGASHPRTAGVSAGHQAMHQELSALRSTVDTRSRIRLVEPKTLMPDRFGKKNGPSWRTWSYLARDLVGVVHATLKQAMNAAENQKQKAQTDDLSRTTQSWLEQSTGDQLPKNMRLAILLSMCAIDLKKELTAQQHLFPEYSQMKAHIVTVINNRTRGVAPMMMGNLSDKDSNHHASSDESLESDDGELYRLEIRSGKKVFTKSRPDSSKVCGRICHIRADCRAKTHINGGHPKYAPRGKSAGNCEDEETETTKCAIGDHRFGFLRGIVRPR